MTTQTKPSHLSYQDLIEIRDRSFRVHSSVYTDERVFEHEVAEIFEKTWVYVGHESEVAERGLE